MGAFYLPRSVFTSHRHALMRFLKARGDGGVDGGVTDNFADLTSSLFFNLGGTGDEVG